jgi:N6-L-threonylcarbamoyladenine synthase
MLNTAEMKGGTLCREDICASLTKVICDSVVHQLDQCFKKYKYKTLLAAGGVLANSHLRKALSDFCAAREIDFHVPPLSLCGDNGVMIAAAAKYELEAGAGSDMSLDGKPSSKDDWKRV